MIVEVVHDPDRENGVKNARFRQRELTDSLANKLRLRKALSGNSDVLGAYVKTDIVGLRQVARDRSRPAADLQDACSNLGWTYSLTRTLAQAGPPTTFHQKL